jgi:uncharacterized Fe-S center protein
MEQASVFFTDLRVRGNQSLPHKLLKLIDKAGMGQIDFKEKYAAVKIHFGELGNLAYLRPNYARTVVEYIKKRGGKPFLTDCATLYVGSRKNALDHLETAYINGYSPFSAGCHILIADGLKGDDDVCVPVPGGEYVKEAKIGRAIMDADIIISLNHFKAHELTGIGGAVKNLGMGCGSRGGKLEMHASGKPRVIAEACIGCGVCQTHCAHGAVSVTEGKAAIRADLCAGCGRCISGCPKDAVVSPDDESFELTSKKIAEYTKAVLNGRPAFHINFVMDVSPFCDCYSQNDSPIVQDVGMFASFDPVALDTACADACNRLPVMPGSRLASAKKQTGDHFTDNHPGTDWRISLAHAAKLRLGCRDYRLIEV